jgi:hypothetical protein
MTHVAGWGLVIDTDIDSVVGDHLFNGESSETAVNQSDTMVVVMTGQAVIPEAPYPPFLASKNLWHGYGHGYGR